MKTNKTISLCSELNKQVIDSQMNLSEFVEDALRDYFKEPLSQEAIEIESAEIERQMEELNNKRIEAFKKKEKEDLIAKIELPENLKFWIINKEERPTMIEIGKFCKASGIIPFDCIAIAKEWDKIHGR